MEGTLSPILLDFQEFIHQMIFAFFLILFFRSFDATKGLSFVTFPESSIEADNGPSDEFKVDLLYRPGHYDVLYPR